MFFGLAFTDTFDATTIATAAAAAGTVGTLIAALVQLSRERTLRRRSEKREQAEKISAWLAKQFVEEEEKKQRIDLRNGSEGPAYQVVLYLVFIQGAGPGTGKQVEEIYQTELDAALEAGNKALSEGTQIPPTCTGPLRQYRQTLSILPPGRYHTTVDRGPTMMYRRHGVELAFTDRAGVHWLRSAAGALTEIKQSPPEYYGLHLPIHWDTPDSSNDHG